NAGHTNTGGFNTGNVNTGAFNSGSFNNGALWTGDHHGLVGFSYSIEITGSTLVDINETLNLGPVHIDQIDIPGMSLFDIHELVNIGPFRIEPIDVPAVVLDIHETMVIPPIVFLPSMTIGGQTYT
ncbi:pentapeptide repeat-containing protein, partial [Mycobacterium tuberculosis]